jgi:anthranilate synthase component 1
MFPTTPDRATFKALASQGNVIPVCREILADMETPVSAFKRLAHRPNAFLLESVEGGERMARYSFLGSDPRVVLRSRGSSVSLTERGKTRLIPLSKGEDPLHVLEAELAKVKFVETPNLPRFVGGAVGYIGYDWVRFLEPIGDKTHNDLDLDDVYLMLTDTLCIFDHVKHRIIVLANAHIEPETDLDVAYDTAVEKVEDMIAALRAPIPDLLGMPGKRPSNPAPWESNLTRARYDEMLTEAKELIGAGDIIQVVLSQRFSRPFDGDAFDVYRALRSLNPSPYMFFLKFDDGPILVGASPEILCTVEERTVRVRPIAGTRKRGETPEEDAALEAELLADEKERAEHIMLVDLGRNDIGRVCEYGSVKVTDLMIIEKYSHVMHIVSNVCGKLRSEITPMDVLRATFPAGTLSGAPKVRAMQIIESLEPTRRGVYGGAIGYFSYNGNLDASITIRTAVIHNGKVHVQAGGGIVADSQHAAEFEETVNKSAAARRAVEFAEAGLDTVPVLAEVVEGRFSRIEIIEPQSQQVRNS